jgi:acetylornithine deacetylase/succinyl-diaminopimelate desuccinylase-like protein
MGWQLVRNHVLDDQSIVTQLWAESAPNLHRICTKSAWGILVSLTLTLFFVTIIESAHFKMHISCCSISPNGEYPMPASTSPQTSPETERVLAAIRPDRLLRTAQELVAVPSPTRSAGAVADKLAEILKDDGFTVERPIADWPDSPAVVVRYTSGRPGRVLQFDGHLDTVHLPFVPPRFEDGLLYGSGSSDMKGGIAAYTEALRALAETNALPGGGILLTAHDHHEGPWGDRRQLRALVREGYVGDGVLIPEYLADRLPVAGRGSAIFDITITRPGHPVHEVLRPPATPDVIATGAEVVRRLLEQNGPLSAITAPYVGSDSFFVGKFQAGEIFNQSPTECKISGTRRWVTPGTREQILRDFQTILDEIAEQTHTTITLEVDLPGDAFTLNPDTPLIAAFQSAYTTVTGAPLPLGNKPFVDDASIIIDETGLPAITHGPAATGAHTLYESVPLDELVRVARVYALTAMQFCGQIA